MNITTELEAAHRATALAASRLAAAQEKADKLSAQIAADRLWRLVTYSQGVIETYDADAAAANAAYEAATQHCYKEMLRDATAGLMAYLDLLKAAARRRVVTMRLQNALSTIGKQTYKGVAIPQVPYHSQPGTYQEMVARAIDLAGARISGEIEDALHNEIIAAEGGE